MAAVTQLGYIGISASNLDAWEQFATEVLGLQVSGRETDSSLFLKMDEYRHRIIVHPGAEDDLAYAGWQVTDERALQEMSEQLKAVGVEPSFGTSEEAAARHVEGLIKFQDPSGIPSEVFYGPPMNFDSPFNSPRSISGFVTGEMGLGHIVLFVDDRDESVRFYRDVLGMRISDFIRNMAFFHCNPRHHTLALMEAKAPKRLNHFMLQLNSINDVGATYDMCQDQEIPIVRGMGRHTNDHMVSFYLRSPSGFDIEWGWGAREVDDATWQVARHEKGSIWGHRPAAETAASRS